MQKHNQYRDHQGCPHRQIFRHGGHRVVNQLGAVIHRPDRHAPGQARLHLCHPLLQCRDDLGGVLPLGHNDDALHHGIGLEFLLRALGAALAGVGDDAGAHPPANTHCAKIRHHHRFAAFGRHHGAANVIEIGKQADAANHKGFRAALHQAAAVVGTVVLNRAGDLIEGDAEAFQRIRVDTYLILLDGRAEADHIGHAWHHAQARLDYPVLQRTHFVFRHGRRHFKHVAVHLAHRRGERAERGLHTGGQTDTLQAFNHLLARKIIVGAISKSQGHHRQSGNRHRADLCHAGRAGHADFNRQRDRTFHFFRCLTTKLRDDLHLHVLHVGKCLNRQIVGRAQAGQHQRAHCQQHEQALGDNKLDQAFEHGDGRCALVRRLAEKIRGTQRCGCVDSTITVVSVWRHCAAANSDCSSSAPLTTTRSPRVMPPPR